MSRSIVHILLSLLLLLSQQAALLHGVAHASELREGPQRQALARPDDGRGGKPAKTALHGACAHCAASAQLALALPATAYMAVLLDLAYDTPAGPRRADPCLAAACIVQPRGPPQA
jgi:hypothetical protein